MLKAPDFDRSEMKGVLAMLKSPLMILNIDSGGQIIVEAMRTIRCVVKSVLNRLVEPTANK